MSEDSTAAAPEGLSDQRPPPPPEDWLANRASLRQTIAVAGITKPTLVVLGVSSVASGALEGALLALLVATAAALVADKHAVLDIGPLSIDLARSTAFELLAVIIALRLVAQAVLAYIPAALSSRMQTRLRDALLRAYLSAPWSVQVAEPEGHLQGVSFGHVNRTSEASLNIAALISAILNLAVLLVVALAIAPLVAALLLLLGGAMSLAFRPAAHLARRYSGQLATLGLGFGEQVAEVSRVTQEVGVFGVSASVSDRLSASSEKMRRPYLRTQLIARLLPVGYQTASVAVAVIGLVAVDVTGSVSFPALGAVVLILIRGMSWAQAIHSSTNSLHQAAPFVKGYADALVRYETREDTTQTTPPSELHQIQLRGVSFSYRPNNPVLVDITTSLSVGETVGIVGPSGAGKSTLVQILLRLRAPTAGDYMIDGRPAGLIHASWWARQVTLVPQDTHLIRGTVTENIRFFRDWVSEEDVLRAASLANISDEVLAMPDGFNTLLGHRHDALSGGQRQRVALARALAGSPRLLVLDEPTSALDTTSETRIREAIESLRASMLVVIVAHRASTLQVCDRLLVLEDGHLVADAPRAELASDPRLGALLHVMPR